MVRASFRAVEPALAADPDNPLWAGFSVPIDRTWRGDPAPPVLATTARLLWTSAHLWVGFVCAYDELDVDEDGDPATERHGLWERDVCEAFVQSPSEASAESYKEFEVAPTGQWFDAAIRHPRTAVDWHWDGGMATAAAIDREARVWRAVMRLPFAGFGGRPRPGDTWRLNLFRIGRVQGDRQFLALAPTCTATPDFHVPGAFVPLRFDGTGPG
jgi:hypothetical protein